MTRAAFLTTAAVGALVAANSASASTFDLTFEGVGNSNPVGSYYNGGAGGDLGVTFSSNAFGIVSAQDGGSGNFAGNPSGDTVLFFSGGQKTTVNDATGFDSGFSFYYSSIAEPVTVKLYAGLHDTGTLLATLQLPMTPSSPPPGHPNEVFDPFETVGVSFAGTAKSVDFGNVQDQVAFDNITFGSSIPIGVPEPGSLALLSAGLVGAGLARRYVRRSRQPEDAA